MLMRTSSTAFAWMIVAAASSGWAQTAEQQAVEGVMASFLEARNARDAEAVSKHFAPDYDQSNLTQGTIQIRSGEERYEAYRTAFMEGRMRNDMASETKSFRLLTDDVALLDAQLSFVNEDGRQALSNFATFVFVKREGEWLIGAVRMSPLSPGSGSN